MLNFLAIAGYIIQIYFTRTDFYNSLLLPDRPPDYDLPDDLPEALLIGTGYILGHMIAETGAYLGSMISNCLQLAFQLAMLGLSISLIV